MINKKIIALDIDGTLFNDHHEVSSYTKEVLISLQQQGVSVVLVSGRDITSLLNVGAEIHLSQYPQNGYICLNGLEIYDVNQRCLHKEERLKKKDALALEKIAKVYAIDIILIFEDKIYIVEYGSSQFIEHNFAKREKEIVSCVSDIDDKHFTQLRKIVFVQDSDYIKKYLQELHDQIDHDYEMTMVEPEWIEINPYGLNKGHALEIYTKLKDMTMDDVIAFGNGENDIEMLKRAGLGVAMGNAFDSVKAIADDVCDDHNHDGIGKYLMEV